jgi:hypothetical protein
MSIFDEVLKHMDGNAIAGIAKQLGASPQQAQSAIQVALPAILGGMQRNISNGGAEALHRAVSKDHQGVDLGGLLGSVLGGNSGGGVLGQVMGMMGGGQQQSQGAGGLLGQVMGMMGGGQQQAQNPIASAGFGILKHVLGIARIRLERPRFHGAYGHAGTDGNGGTWQNDREQRSRCRRTRWRDWRRYAAHGSDRTATAKRLYGRFVGR